MRRLSIALTAALVILIMLACPYFVMAEERSGLGSLNTSLISGSSADQTAGNNIELSMNTDPAPEPEAKKAWTFMVYMCASNNLGDGARSDLAEMAKSGFDASMVNVVVFTGGATRWGWASVPTDKNALFEIHDKEIKQVMEYDPIANMSIDSTLSQFIDTATTQYPAEKYALILWDHGAGPNIGVIQDAVFNTGNMELATLRSALGNSQFKDHPLEILGFDACLMGNVEVAKAIQPYARYMVASEESEPCYGWNYSFLGEIKATTPTDGLATNIVDRYMDYYTQHPDRASSLKVSLACIDLSQINSLKASCSDYFKEVSGLLSEESYLSFAKIRDKTLTFNKDLDLIDLGAFVKNLDEMHLPSQQKLVDSIDKTIQYNRSMAEDATGLTIYHPYAKGIMYNNKFKSKYIDLSLEDEYTRYIDKFVSYLTNQPYVAWSGTSTLDSLKDADEQDEAVKDANTSFTLQLTEQQYDFLAEAQLQVFESADESAGYALVSIIPDVVKDDENHTVSATYVHRALFITTADGSEILSGALPYDLIGDDFYSLEVTLVGHDEDGSEVRQPARLEFTLQTEEGELELAQILLPEGDDFYSPRHSYTLSDFDSMEIMRDVRMPVPMVEGDNTLYLSYDQWETVSPEPCTVPLDGSRSLRMLHDQLKRDDIYVGFALRDYQNRHYVRDLQKLIPKPNPHIVTVGGHDDDYLTLMMPWPTLQTEGSRPGVKLSFRVKNTSELNDAIIRITNIRLNGQPCDLSLDIYGNGAYDGLTVGEEQFATLLVPADLLRGIGTLQQIDYDIQILNAGEGDSLFKTLENCWAIFSLDVSAFDA